MNPTLIAVIAAERHRELERQAGCCTPIAEHRRTLRRGRQKRLTRHHAPATGPAVCCA